MIVAMNAAVVTDFQTTNLITQFSQKPLIGMRQSSNKGLEIQLLKTLEIFQETFSYRILFKVEGLTYLKMIKVSLCFRQIMVTSRSIFKCFLEVSLDAPIISPVLVCSFVCQLRFFSELAQWLMAHFIQHNLF